MPMIKVKAQNIMLLLAMMQSAGSFHFIKSYSTRKLSQKWIMLICIPSLVLALLFSCSAPSNVEKALDEHQYIYLVSGDGYLGFIQNLPPNKRIHLQLHEPHRGLHEDSLHRTITGGFKRPWWITSLILRSNYRFIIFPST